MGRVAGLHFAAARWGTRKRKQLQSSSNSCSSCCWRSSLSWITTTSTSHSPTSVVISFALRLQRRALLFTFALEILYTLPRLNCRHLSVGIVWSRLIYDDLYLLALALFQLGPASPADQCHCCTARSTQGEQCRLYAKGRTQSQGQFDMSPLTLSFWASIINYN